MRNALAVDPCLILDVLENDAAHADEAVRLLDAHANESLEIPVFVYITLAEAFNGDRALQDEFLGRLGIATVGNLADAELPVLHRAWARSNLGKDPRERPAFAVFLVGACAFATRGLLTRRPEKYRELFPTLNLVTS